MIELKNIHVCLLEYLGHQALYRLLLPLCLSFWCHQQTPAECIKIKQQGTSANNKIPLLIFSIYIKYIISCFNYKLRLFQWSEYDRTRYKDTQNKLLCKTSSRRQLKSLMNFTTKHSYVESCKQFLYINDNLQKHLITNKNTL